MRVHVLSSYLPIKPLPVFAFVHLQSLDEFVQGHVGLREGAVELVVPTFHRVVGSVKALEHGLVAVPEDRFEARVFEAAPMATRTVDVGLAEVGSEG